MWGFPQGKAHVEPITVIEEGVILRTVDAIVIP